MTEIPVMLNPEHLPAESIGEFYPEAVNAAERVIRLMGIDDNTSILAACVVSEALCAFIPDHLLTEAFS